ncbi:MAG TPA: N-acetyltransferase [Pseudonocardiaceae bacterium]|nr:N-acetyltransferase [Pseudonocardiaceae bacterium]
MLLRREHPGDQSAVRAVHNAAFGGGADTAEAQLVDDLRAGRDVIAALSIVAVVDGDVVGHVICSRASITDRPSIGLGPLGVMPGSQRRGIGQALMHAVLAAADALDAPAVVLLGDPGYYSRFGFVAGATLGVLPPVPEWAGHFQVRPLNSWDDSLRGIFRYAPAFDRLL